MDHSLKTPSLDLEKSSSRHSVFVPLIQAFVWLICLIWMVAMFIPLTPNILGNWGLDASWCAVLNWARIHHLVFGKQIIFTYGPWGFIDADFYNPGTYSSLVIARLIIFLAVVIGWWALSRRLCFSQIISPILLTLFFSLDMIHDCLFFLMPILAILLHYSTRDLSHRRIRWDWPLLFLVSALALVSMIKMSYMGTIFFIMGLMVFDDLYQARVPLSGIVFGLCVGLWWVLAYQPLNAFIPWLWTAPDLTSGYSGAMMVPASFAPRITFYILISAAMACLLFLIQRRDKVRAVISTASLAVVLFGLFKAGFVRDDVHERVASAGLIMASFLLLPVYWRGSRSLFVRTAAVLFPLLCFGNLELSSLYVHRYFPGMTFDSPAAVLSAQLSSVPEFYRATLSEIEHPQMLRRNFDAKQRSIKLTERIPPATGTMDMYAYDQVAILARHDDYRPRPVFQGYAAYTSALQKINANYLASKDAPQTLLVNLATIDNRFPAMDDAESWPVMFARYKVTDFDGTYLTLQKCAVAHSIALQKIESIDKSINDLIPVPDDFKEPIWVAIDFRSTIMGAICSALYKPPAIDLVVNYSDGSKNRYRLIANVARGGFLLSPAPVNAAAFANFFQTPGKPFFSTPLHVQSMKLALERTHRPAFWYKRNLKIDFYRLQYEPNGVSNALQPTSLMKLMWSAPPMDRFSTLLRFGDAPDGHTALWAHPPRILSLSVPPNSQSLVFHYGILREAWPTANPVHFSVSILNANGKPIRQWSAIVDPVHNLTDRAVLSAQIKVPSDGRTAVFETAAVKSLQYCWAYWSDVNVR